MGDLLEWGPRILPPSLQFLWPIISDALADYNRKGVKLDERAVLDLLRHKLDGRCSDAGHIEAALRAVRKALRERDRV